MNHLGFKTRVTREGDVNLRFDATIIDDYDSIPIEIKSPREDREINIKAIRQALENKIILLSRHFYKTRNETTSLAVAFEYPPTRSDVYELISDIKNDILIKGRYFEIHIKEKYVENKKYIGKVYDKWLKEYANGALTDLVKKYQIELEKYNIKVPKIEIRQMKSRWGSCLPRNNKVIFNLNLIKTPICCIEYVVLHELSHFKYPNHSKSFYNFVTIFMPDWNTRKKILDEEFMGVV